MALLAKAERSIGSGPVRLKLDRREAPELHGQTDAEQVQRWVMLLEDWCRTGWVTLVLAPPKEFDGFADRQPKLELQDFAALAEWAGYTPQALRWQRQWLDHLATHWSTTNRAPEPKALLDYLARNPLLALQDMPLAEATRSLEALQALCASGIKMPLREASAQVFQGRSKVLDSREELLLLLGAMPQQFHEAPIQLLVAFPQGPGAFNEVLFIENLVTFERMAELRRPIWASSLLVYAAGFKGVARRLRSPQGCSLYVRASAPGSTQALDNWLFGMAEQPVRFFGDLDYAGMQILARLREVFTDAQAWLPGYGALAEALARGDGHAPGLAAKELQTDPGHTGCVYADEQLLPLMRQHRRFIDQESFQLHTSD